MLLQLLLLVVTDVESVEEVGIQMNQESDTKSRNVIELSGFRKKKETAEEFARGRNPLYVSHNTGKISGSKSAETEEENFGDRYSRIKASLEKINRLMSELKKISSTASVESIESKSPSAPSSKQR